MPAETRQRLDKWLWFARIVKTRPMAVALVEAGHIRVNRNRVTKPAHSVGLNDVLTITLHGHVRVLRITGCASRRGPACAAQRLYQSAIPNPDGSALQKEDASGNQTC